MRTMPIRMAAARPRLRLPRWLRVAFALATSA
jgi:hypothetical protein